MSAVFANEKRVHASTNEAPKTDGGNRRIALRLVDHLGRTSAATLPAHVPLGRVKERIVERLQVSPVDSNGQPVIYDLVYKGKVLTDDDTLSAAGVLPDDEVELSPSIQSA